MYLGVVDFRGLTLGRHIYQCIEPRSGALGSAAFGGFMCFLFFKFGTEVEDPATRLWKMREGQRIL